MGVVGINQPFRDTYSAVKWSETPGFLIIFSGRAVLE
jgi:hypothetical protein